MASLKIVLHSKTYTDGTRAVMLQLIYETVAGRQFKRTTICKIETRHWNAKASRVRSTHPNHFVLNQTIGEAYHQAESRLLDLQRSQRPITAETVFRPQTDQAGLLAATAAYINRLRGLGFHGTADNHQSFLNRLKQFIVYPRKPLNDEVVSDVGLNEITEEWVLRLVKWLKEHHIKSENTLKVRMDFMRSVLRDARKRGLTTNDPLALLEFKGKKTKKPALSTRQLDDLMALDLSGRLALTRDTFMLQFYFYGARINEILLLKKDHIQKGRGEGRVEYTMGKTKALVSIPLRAAALVVVKRYTDDAVDGAGGPYLLPWMVRSERADFSEQENARWIKLEIKACTTRIGTDLKELARLAGIPINLTTHVARHTFARLADKTVSDRSKIQKALRHSVFSMTEIYLEELGMSDLDEDMDAVYG